MPKFLGHDAKFFLTTTVRIPSTSKRAQKKPQVFQKISAAHGAAAFGFCSHSQRGATAFQAVAPLDCPSARTGAAVNGGAFEPFILTIDGREWLLRSQ